MNGNSEIDFSLSQIIITNERSDGSSEWIDFKINGISYEMRISKHNSENMHYITGVFHSENQCPFCHYPIEMSYCDVVFFYKLTIFKLMLPQSKNRLKWVVGQMM